MENRNNRELNKMRNYFEPLMSVNSSKDFSSSINKDNKNNQYIRNIFFNQNQDFFITNNLQNKISFDKINNISLKRKKHLKRFNTEKHFQKLNLNTINNNLYIMPEDEEIIFAKKTNMYTNYNNNNNNNGKSKNIIQNRVTYIHTNDDTIARKINQNYNPKYLSGTKNNNSLITSKINNNNNTLLGKKSSNNINTYNHNLNTTIPIKYRRFNSNNLIKLNNMLSFEKKLSANQTIIKKDNINDNFFSNSQKNNTSKKNITKNLRIMIDNNNKRRKTRNDLSWDYSIGILNRGPNYIIKKNSSHNKNRNFLSNYYSERNKLYKEIDTNTFNDDEIGDKDIDEIVDDLDTFFNEEKKNNTVILNDKGFSDDSLSDIANDIVKTFQDVDNKDINEQLIVPSSPSPELGVVTNNNTDKQYNNNYLSKKKIISGTKSAFKPTIVNNFFISPVAQNKYNNLPKDFNYNLFVVNEYNNKINSNSTIPTLVTQTYKSPDILRGEKNNQQLYNGIGESEISDFYLDNENINNNINNKDNHDLIQNQKNNQNLIIDLNYSNDINNNIQINPNIHNNINNLNNTLNTLNINDEINKNNTKISPINTNEINNINNNFNSNNYYLNDEELILNNNNQSKINLIKSNYEYNKNLVKKLNSNIQKVNFKPNNSFKNNIREKKSEEMKINDSSLNNIFASNNINNIKVFKNPNNKKIINKNIDNKYLLKNIIKNKRKISKPNNSLDNNKNINKNNYQYNSSKNINNINKNNNISPNNKNYYININNNNISMNSTNIDSTIQNNLTSNNILIKNRKHISFNLNNNIFIKFKKDDLINNSEITTQNGNIYNHIEKNMDLYKSELKMIKPKPIIKKFLLKDIKVNKDYILVENLQERQILPEFYDDFEEEDIKSLEKSLERSIDKKLY